MWVVKYKDYGEPGIIMTTELFEERPTEETLRNRWLLLWGSGETPQLTYEDDGKTQRVFEEGEWVVECQSIRVSTPDRTNPYLLDKLSCFEHKGLPLPEWAQSLRSNEEPVVSAHPNEVTRAFWAMQVLDAFQAAGGKLSPPRRLGDGWVFYSRNEATGALGRHAGPSLRVARLLAARELLAQLPEDVRVQLGQMPD